MTLRCLIVDDDPTFIELARQVLADDGDISIVGAAANSSEATTRVAELQPDLVLVDVRLGDESGVALARRIADHDGKTRVILISSYRHSDLAGVLPENEGIGFISKVDLSTGAIRAALS